MKAELVAGGIFSICDNFGNLRPILFYIVNWHSYEKPSICNGISHPLVHWRSRCWSGSNGAQRFIGKEVLDSRPSGNRLC